MLGSPPHHNMRYLISHSLSAEDFRELYDSPSYHHTNNNQILVNQQFGFRHASSTDIVTYKFTKHTMTTLNNELVGCIFLDLHKAFDCVSYNIVLFEMEFYGIFRTENNLIKSYLQNTYQRVLVD